MNHAAVGTYSMKPPIIKVSRLACKGLGGIGKALSEGYALNFAIGCLNGCPFCYVDSIHRRFRGRALGFLGRDWGDYMFVPDNIDEVIEETPWKRWKGKEVMMSSTHDPFLPELNDISGKIIERALSEGVRFCFQTRSPLILDHLDMLEDHGDQVRVQVSIATYNEKLHRAVEPRIAAPKERMNILKKVKEREIGTGIIVAPIFPPIGIRPDAARDLSSVMRDLSRIGPDHIFGEMIHARGRNLNAVEKAIGHPLGRKDLLGADEKLELLFDKILDEHDLKGTWWPEHNRI